MSSDLPPLNPLRAFAAAARLLSIRRAAQQLNVTPAAVSRQVKVLEEHLGVVLFRRGSNMLTLTAEGERYIAGIGPHFDAIAEATRSLTGRSGNEVLRIRAYTTFAMRWLIPRLPNFHDAAPGAEVQLTTSLESIDFEREDVDGAIRLGDGRWPGLLVDRLVANELVPVCSPGLKRTAGLNSAADLAQVRLLHSLARPDDWMLWLEAAEISLPNAAAGLKFQSSALCYEAASLGQGVAIAQKVLVERDLENGTLTIPFGPTFNREAFTYYFVFPEDRLRKLAFRHFRRWLQSQSAA